MRKYCNMAFGYAILGMLFGVFYREFTKLNGFEGKTMLSVVHTHFFALGMLMLLLVGLICDRYDWKKTKLMVGFDWFYNIGLLLTSTMFVVRGIVQVLNIELTKGIDSAISGFAGIGHICLSVGIILFFMLLKKSLNKK